MMTKLNACAIALCLSVQPGVQEKAAQKLVTRAQAAIQRKQPEKAARLLRSARLAAARAPEGADDVTASVRDLLPEVDPVHGKRAKAEAKLAQSFLKLADGYIAKGWTETGLAMLERAELFAPLLVASRLRKVRRPKPNAPSIFDYFKGGRQLYVTKSKWTFENEVVTSPKPRRSSMVLLSTKSVGRNHRIRVEAKIGSSRGKAALIFGYRSSGDFHLIEVAHQGNTSELKLHRWHDGDWEKLHSRFYRVRRAMRSDWLPLIVETRGQEISWQIGSSPVYVDTSSGKRLHGYVGLFVGGASGSTTPVEFRNLVIEEL